MQILITGGLGFIGAAVAVELIQQGHSVVLIDNVTDYYNPHLKHDRLNIQIAEQVSPPYYRYDITTDTGSINMLFAEYNFDLVIHLAAQPGVRYSTAYPANAIKQNIIGFTNILDACNLYNVPRVLYASSSSVYGNSIYKKYDEGQRTDNPVSIYGATKKANEILAEVYAKTYDMIIEGLRFFTVYGPWGRPDMAPWIFTEKILKGDTIQVFNHGNQYRDFTHIGDITGGISALINTPAKQGHSVFNIGRGEPVFIMDFIAAIEQATGKKADIEFLPAQSGDVSYTCANTEKLQRAAEYTPRVSIKEGIENFVAWFKKYHRIDI